MATELYGVDARLVESIARTPVSTETTLIFIGASASGALNKPVLITSMSDYETKLGGEPGDGYNLTEAAIAAFSVANVDKCWMIPVTHSSSFSAAEYIGSAESETGVYAIEKLLRENPTTVNLICAPSITDSSVLSAINTIAQKAANHWQSFFVYDVSENDDQSTEEGYIDVEEIVSSKQLESERARAVWGHVKTSGGYIISGAALQTCLMAVSDANYGVPARCGGNLAAVGIQGVINSNKKHQAACTYHTSNNHIVVTIVDTEYPEYSGVATCTLSYTQGTPAVSKTYTENVQFTDGEGTISLDISTVTDFSYVGLDVEIPKDIFVNIKESDGNQLSADGVCSWINYGGGNWRTWGDHTSAYSAGSVADERARFDNYMRMQMMIANRFQLIYRFTIDDPMTLQMRNDVITEEQNYLNSLVALEAIIGSPKVEFVAAENTIDSIAQGYFTWSISTTEAPPLKYMLAKVAYTQAGLDVLTQEG